MRKVIRLFTQLAELFLWDIKTLLSIARLDHEMFCFSSLMLCSECLCIKSQLSAMKWEKYRKWNWNFSSASMSHLLSVPFWFHSIQALQHTTQSLLQHRRVRARERRDETRKEWHVKIKMEQNELSSTTKLLCLPFLFDFFCWAFSSRAAERVKWDRARPYSWGTQKRDVN